MLTTISRVSREFVWWWYPTVVAAVVPNVPHRVFALRHGSADAFSGQQSSASAHCGIHHGAATAAFWGAMSIQVLRLAGVWISSWRLAVSRLGWIGAVWWWVRARLVIARCGARWTSWIALLRRV